MDIVAKYIFHISVMHARTIVGFSWLSGTTYPIVGKQIHHKISILPLCLFCFHWSHPIASLWLPSEKYRQRIWLELRKRRYMFIYTVSAVSRHRVIQPTRDKDRLKWYWAVIWQLPVSLISLNMSSIYIHYMNNQPINAFCKISYMYINRSICELSVTAVMAWRNYC